MNKLEFDKRELFGTIQKVNMNKTIITLKEYQGFQRAYDFFNRELFAGSLPQVLVTLQRHANTRGYFAPFRFKG